MLDPDVEKVMEVILQSELQSALGLIILCVDSQHILQ